MLSWNDLYELESVLAFSYASVSNARASITSLDVIVMLARRSVMGVEGFWEKPLMERLLESSCWWLEYGLRSGRECDWTGFLGIVA